MQIFSNFTSQYFLHVHETERNELQFVAISCLCHMYTVCDQSRCVFSFFFAVPSGLFVVNQYRNCMCDLTIRISKCLLPKPQRMQWLRIINQEENQSSPESSPQEPLPLPVTSTENQQKPLLRIILHRIQLYVKQLSIETLAFIELLVVFYGLQLVSSLFARTLEDFQAINLASMSGLFTSLRYQTSN